MLSKKTATAIAALYNTIIVSESMQLKARNEEDWKGYELWRGHAHGAVETLREKHGIRVVGYDHP
jgi:hypothetical protein